MAKLDGIDETTFHIMELEEGDDGECILVLKKDDNKEVHCITSGCDYEYEEEVINISDKEMCQGCQTDGVEFISTSFIVNIPVFFCAQPTPGVATTQCNIPITVDASVGTDCLFTPTQLGHVKGNQFNHPEESLSLLHNDNAKMGAETFGPSENAVSYRIDKYPKLDFAKGKGIPKRGRPRGSSRQVISYFNSGRKPKNVCRKKKKVLESKKTLSSESDTQNHGRSRRRTKKMYADFEYDLVDSEDELESKLDDDDNDDDWKEDSEGVSDNEEEEEEDAEESGQWENIKKKESEEEEENLDQLWRNKGDNKDHINSLFSDSKEITQVSDIKKEELDEDMDYKSLIDAVVWEQEMDSDNNEELYGSGDPLSSGETGLVDKKQIQTVGVDDLIPEKGERLVERFKKYAEKSRIKYQQEKLINSDGKVVFKCLKCNKEFNKRSHLTEHRKVHARKFRIYECNKCGKVFHEARKYFSHLSFHERIFECRTCGRKFSLLANLKKHIVIHQDAPGQVCEVCGSQFASDDQLKLHYEAEHSEDHIRAYIAKCMHCGKEYMREEAFKQHMSRAPYICPTCSKSFGCEYELKKHVRYEHGQCVCEFCGKSFKNNSLLNHIKIMHREAHVQCPHCPKKFVYRSKMLSHIDSSHNVEKKYKCNKCPYSAKTANSLNFHRRKCHSDPKKFHWYECDICNRKFYLPSKLTLHYRAHTGEKPFACQTCGKTFASKYNMIEHERAVHGERIEIKNDDGSTSVRVVKHRRAPRASGRRCDLCGVDFPSSTTIIEHMKKVHASQSTEPVDETTEVKVSLKFEPQEEEEAEGDKCLEYEVIGSAGDVILSASSSMVNIRADEIPENATLVEIDGVEYQVVRQ